MAWLQVLRGLVVATVTTVTASVHALDPTTADCLAATEKSTTLRQQHKLRAARKELLICAASSCPVDIRQECSRRVSEVNAAMPTIVFEVKDTNNNDLSAVTVDLDGQRFAERLEGTALSIDPGEHRFHFESDGKLSQDHTFVIREGEKERRERIRFESLARNPWTPSAPAVLDVERTANNNTDRPPREPGPSYTKRTIGYVTGGLGIALLGLAVFEQTMALSRSSDSHDAAASTNPSVQATAPELHDQASTAQTYAIASASAGVAALGVGLYLVLTSGSSAKPELTRVQPDISLSSAGLRVSHRW